MVGDIAHVCNRGVEKRRIFLDTRDYKRFVENLYFLNNWKGKLLTERKNILQTPGLLPKQDKLVEVLKWCVLPNHYHLLLYEAVEGGISEFVRRVGNAYTKYFNTKHEGRSGYLFQNSAQIIRITEDRHFLYIPFYIDLNPLDSLGKTRDKNKLLDHLVGYQWSSVKDYYENGQYTPIINKDLFFKLFGSNLADYEKELLDMACQGVEPGNLIH